ncbi:CobW family GTP-binding protein [Nocardia otitidiscaviarum]|uniref:CobW family GTP-binding protein n=1 Tax=Nocardia otitidiscaviarum TaxID=1823 RepID=UPI0018947248|nr:GTP-binding protein [Nocardia otitidiscaviarum]MBF6181933.1 GTP-binding protein [Nocardia otitidiscaviarum]
MHDGGKIPVTVLTGFLGSGKTTLVNHILTAQHGYRIAVIENEFGEIPIDNDLVLNADEKIIEMSNGCCLCCTARTDLIDILRSLLARSDRFDRILIETSGLADPNPVAQTFFVDDEIEQHFTLDAILTLVDAKHVRAHLAEGDSAGVGSHVVDQIAFADRIVINKVDLVAPEVVREVRETVRGINATAEIITSQYAAVDIADVLGIGAFDVARTVSGDPHWLDDGDHQHDPRLTSVGVEVDGRLDHEEFESWLRAHLVARGDDVYRMKGLFAVDDDPRRFVLQGVHRLFDIRPSTPWRGDERKGKVVFIGRDLDRAELTRGVLSCLVR